MSFHAIIRPSHLPELPSNSKLDEILDVDNQDLPQLYVYMDGKPSDRYEKGGKYCLVMLVAFQGNTITSMYDRVNEKLKLDGFKFKKVTEIRSKRRDKYINAVLNILIDISKVERGLRYNTKVVIGSAEGMNPKNIEKYHDIFRDLYNSEIHDKYVTFEDGDKVIKVNNDELGGMIWWHESLIRLACEYKIEERNISWWLHMDRFPLDKNLERSRLFTSLLDKTFNQKLWVSFPGYEGSPMDVFPDFYAYLFYQYSFHREHLDTSIVKKFETLVELNTKD